MDGKEDKKDREDQKIAGEECRLDSWLSLGGFGKVSWWLGTFGEAPGGDLAERLKIG